MPPKPATVQVVRNAAELNAALANPQVKTVKLFNKIEAGTSTFTAKRVVDIDLNGQTLEGNLKIQTGQQGSITLSAGTVDGDLTIDAPQVSFVNNATVTGATNIINVAPNTFENNGDLQGTVTISDTDGTRFVNNGTTGVIDVATDKAVTLEGSFTSEIKLSKAAKVTIPTGTSVAQLTVTAANAEVTNNGTVSTLQADAAVKVEGTGNVEGSTGSGTVSGDSAATIEATNAVNKVEASLTTADVKDALSKVNGLSEGAAKTALLDRLKALTIADDATTFTVRTVNGDNADVNPNGAVIVRLTALQDSAKISDLGSSLTISLLKGEDVLATNTLAYDRITDPKVQNANLIDSPFNLGTNGLDKWAWTRGAYAINGETVQASDLPDKVKVTYVKEGITYSFTKSINEQLNVPAKYVDPKEAPLNAIQEKVVSLKIDSSTAMDLTSAVGNAELAKIQDFKVALDKVQSNTIPAAWITQMLSDANGDIVTFFTSGAASNRETVVNAIGTQVPVADKEIILGVYDALKATLSAQ